MFSVTVDQKNRLRFPVDQQTSAFRILDTFCGIEKRWSGYKATWQYFLPPPLQRKCPPLDLTVGVDNKDDRLSIEVINVS